VKLQSNTIHPLTNFLGDFDMKDSIDRRQLFKGGMAAALAIPSLHLLSGNPALAQQPSPLAAPLPGTLTRKIPKTGDVLTAVGLGTFLTFDVLPGQKRDHLRQITKQYWDGGVRVLDTSPLYGTGESSVGDFITEMGINEQLFIANKIWSTGEFLADESHARRSLEQSQQRLWRQSFDLMQCHSLVNVDVAVPMMNVWKKEGRTRYVGVTHHENTYHQLLANWIDRGTVDFVQVNYSIFNRGAEEKVFPAAQNKGAGVLINMAMEKGRLHKVVQGRALPDFAREFGAVNWAQFFIKYVISHPDVTCCLTATSNPTHAAENIGALRGPLPDRAMRERMVKHMESIPGFNEIGKMPWYPDKRYPGVIGRSQAELRARS
jgi:diketogulonate reductase-like aldo/keto reductase